MDPITDITHQHRLRIQRTIVHRITRLYGRVENDDDTPLLIVFDFLQRLGLVAGVSARRGVILTQQRHRLRAAAAIVANTGEIQIKHLYRCR